MGGYVKGKAIRARYRVRVYIAYIPFPLVHPCAVIVVAVGIRGALSIVRVCILVVEAAAVVIVEMIMCVAIASGRRRSRRGCHDSIRCSKDEMWLNKY